MWKMFTDSPSTLTFCLLQNITCVDCINYSWEGFNSLGCALMLRTNYRCLKTLNISVDVAKCVENVQTFIHYTHFWTVTKNDMTWPNNLFMARFQLIRMFSNAKNKLQICSVTQRQCRLRQICGNFSQISPLHSLFVSCKKWLVLTEQSIHGKV